MRKLANLIYMETTEMHGYPAKMNFIARLMHEKQDFYLAYTVALDEIPFSLSLSLSREPRIKSPLKRPTLRSRLSRAVSFRGSLVSWPTVGRKVSPIYGLGLPSHLRREEISYSADSRTDRACILYVTVCAMKYELRVTFLT